MEAQDDQNEVQEQAEEDVKQSEPLAETPQPEETPGEDAQSKPEGAV